MTLPDPTAFVEAMRPAVRQAAAIARALEGRVSNRPKAGQDSDVKAALTLADTAAQEAMLVPLLENFPEVCIEAEEDTPNAARFPTQGRALVVIDPIDGTLRSYLDGRGPYAVMIGLAIDDVYQAALVALPREGLLFEAVRGAGARRAWWGHEPEPVRVDGEGSMVMCSYEMPEPVEAELTARGHQLAYGCGGALAVAPLIPGVRAGVRWVKTDRISTRGRIGALIAREAGASLASEAGEFAEPIHSPQRALMVAASAEDLVDLQAAVAHVA